MGQNADACLRCDEAESLAAERHEWLPLLWTAHARAVLDLANGRPRDASDRYRDLEVLARVRGVDNPLVVPWAERAVAAHLGCGRRDDARRLMDWLEHSHTQLPSPWVAVVALASRALAADAEGDVEAATADFEEALALHQECNFPLERISTGTAFASLLRRRGSPRRARELLTEALAVCEASGAALRATVVAAELTVAGGRRNVRLKRRSAAAGQNQLTAQEQRVAALAASGKTNPQIGTELYVSSRTIETHLKHIYEKLSIRSRHELMALVLSRQRQS
jgi:DNA-binding CsgD family transcriptional regulator